MHDRLALAAALFSASTLAAQQIVSPSALTNAHGGIINVAPWGPPTASLAGETFHQQIDADLMGTPRVLKGFAFRHGYDQAFVTKNYVITLKVGDAATPPSGMSTTFANNWKTGGAQTTVFSGPLTLPAVPAYPRPPAPADAPVPFTTPHLYTGVEPLLWELYIQSTLPLMPLQGHERGPGTTHTAGMLGVGCAITGGRNPMDSSGSISTSVMTDTLTFGPANSAAVLMLGNTSDKLLGLLQLPFDLAGIGSPGCSLHVNFLQSYPMPTNATGGATFTLPFTMNPGISGIRLRTQWFAVDGQSLVRTSNGLDHSVPYSATTGKPWPQNRIYVSGFTTPPAVGTTGNGTGIVTSWMY